MRPAARRQWRWRRSQGRIGDQTTYIGRDPYSRCAERRDNSLDSPEICVSVGSFTAMVVELRIGALKSSAVSCYYEGRNTLLPR